MMHLLTCLVCVVCLLTGAMAMATARWLAMRQELRDVRMDRAYLAERCIELRERVAQLQARAITAPVDARTKALIALAVSESNEHESAAAARAACRRLHRLLP
jgi:hypothetical protein